MTPTHPVTSGNRKWVLAQSQYLKEKGHDIDFLYVSCPILMKPNSEEDIIYRMKEYWDDHLIVCKCNIVSRLKLTLSYTLRKIFCKGYHTVDDLCPVELPSFVRLLQQRKNYDACIVNYYWLTKVFERLSVAKKAINTHDCFTYKDIVCGKYAWMTTMPNQEAKAMQRCNYIFALQKNEAIYFSFLSPKSKVLDVYCFLKYQETPYIGNHVIVFLSSNNQFNINGLTWFVNEVFLRIIERYPDAMLTIGGSISETAKKMQIPNTQILGFVENEKDFYSLGDVCINPTYEGTGLKIKTFESVAFGKLTIARTHSTHGIYNPEKSPVLASDSPNDWLDFFSQLWEHSDYAKSLKALDKSYIEQMNRYIDEQYNLFVEV